MVRYGRRGALLAAFALLAAVGCAAWRTARKADEPQPRELRPTRLDYVDSDAFDELLESALVNQDPIILIQTTYSKPDWGSRLNAWIAAWNRGGRVSAADGRKARGQVPGFPQVVVDGDSIREFRLLIESLMDRIDDRVKDGVSWWAEERVRNRRITLLRPYNLRFHRNADGNIQLILFHGRYAQYYPEFVRSIALPESSGGEEWDRAYHCSECRQQRPPAEGRLTLDRTAGR
jgi:hypothetical protein